MNVGFEDGGGSGGGGGGGYPGGRRRGRGYPGGPVGAGHGGVHGGGGMRPRDAVVAGTSEEVIRLERKQITVGMYENRNGRYVKVEELAAGMRDTIRVPEEGLMPLIQALQALQITAAQREVEGG